MSPSGSLGYSVSLAASQALLRPPPSPSRPQIGPQHTELPHEGASALGRQRLVPCTPRKHAPERGSFRQRAPPRLKLQTPGLGAQGSTPRGSRAGAPRSSKARRNLLEMLQICKRAGLDAPLQTQARSGVFFLSFFPNSAPPTSRAVSASVRPLPKRGGVYYRTNSSSDLPWSLEAALRRRAFRERKGLRAGLWVPGELQGGLRGRRGWCVVTPTGVLLWVC